MGLVRLHACPMWAFRRRSGDSKLGVRNPAGKGRCKECPPQHPGAPGGQIDDEDAVEGSVFVLPFELRSAPKMFTVVADAVRYSLFG